MALLAVVAAGSGDFCGTVRSAAAAEFYVDPQHGDPSNDGSKQRPWKSLQELFDRGQIESRDWESLPYKAGATRTDASASRETPKKRTDRREGAGH